MKQEKAEKPSIWKWIVSIGVSTGVAGMLCCVAPAVLFMFGLMSGIYAISFADFFYGTDGSAGTGAWVLRGVAVMIGLGGIYLFKRKQDQCSIDPRRRKTNLALVTVLVTLLGIGFFFTLDNLTSWYFDAFIVPAQQAEYGLTTLMY